MKPDPLNWIHDGDGHVATSAMTDDGDAMEYRILPPRGGRRTWVLTGEAYLCQRHQPAHYATLNEAKAEAQRCENEHLKASEMERGQSS